MFISRDQIKVKTGVEVDQTTLAFAQTMIETYIGRNEAAVDNGDDLNILANATLFQAVYINGNVEGIMTQAAVKQLNSADESVTFNDALFAPYMSPFTAIACRGLSWRGTRSVKTGRIFGGAVNKSWAERWVTE